MLNFKDNMNQDKFISDLANEIQINGEVTFMYDSEHQIYIQEGTEGIDFSFYKIEGSIVDIDDLSDMDTLDGGVYTRTPLTIREYMEIIDDVVKDFEEFEKSLNSIDIEI